jgi:putative hydrolase of the HAD superfamily
MDPGSIVWDFDGTLAYREGMWSGTLLEMLQRECPDHGATRDDIRPFIRSGFPWHDPGTIHPGQDPDGWWSDLAPLFQRAFSAMGVPADRAHVLAAQVREEYCRPGKWFVYPDTIPVLDLLSRGGWKHYVLSNHVPELPAIAAGLGLRRRFETIHSSALTGTEKPNPEAFLAILREMDPDSGTVMVGDSVDADVRGAMDVGMPAVLVRRPPEPGLFHSPDLTGIADLLPSLKSVRAGDLAGRYRPR